MARAMRDDHTFGAASMKSRNRRGLRFFSTSASVIIIIIGSTGHS